MSWTDDIRCLYCDGRLPLYKKITDGQFCSTVHRKAYWQEHERLAIERLHLTHDSLRAYRPPGAVEAILGQTELELEQGVPELLPSIAIPMPLVDVLPAIFAADPLPFAVSPEIEHPHSGPAPGSNSTGTENVSYLQMPTLPQWLPDHLATAEPEVLLWTTPPVRPASGSIAGDILMEIVEPTEVPQADKMFGLGRPTACESANLSGEAAPQASMEFPREPELPIDAARLPKLANTALFEAGLRQLPVDRSPRVQSHGADSVRALEMHGHLEVPPSLLITTPRIPRLRLAAGRRYPVRTREIAAAVAGLEPAGFSTAVPGISLPERKVKVMAAAAGSSPRNAAAAESQIPEPSASGLLPLRPAAGNAHSGAGPLPSAPLIPQPLRTEPMRPMSKLEPLETKPIADFVDVPAPVLAAASITAESPAGSVPKAHVWTHAADFWRNAPRDLKTLVFAIPVLLGLALHPTLPKVHLGSPRVSDGFQRSFERVVSERLVNVRQTMADRAAVALDEDFRAGLDDWASRGDVATQWSFDATGFVRPGPLALYRPSLNLTDYQVQFLGLIDKKALSWVVRAADFQNYYVVKLVVLKPGPLPAIGLTRYAVVNGRADSRSDATVPVDAREDMLYRVRLDVHGDDFVLAVQGQMIDNWTEPRLKHGGVGFFAGRGEESRLRWLQVTHQYDMLGRLCAYLAPYNIPSTNGGWQQ